MPIKRKSKFGRILSNQRALSLIGLAILLMIVIPAARNYIHRRSVDQEIADLQDQIKQANDQNNNLNKLVDYLQSDQFVEEKARLDFGLKKNGENVAIVKTGTASGTPDGVEKIFTLPALEKPALKKPVANPERWWNYFFH